MEYRLRYRIRDWFFRLLFPTIAEHESHLVDDCIEMAVKIKQLETQYQLGYATRIRTGANDKTAWVEYGT